MRVVSIMYGSLLVALLAATALAEDPSAGKVTIPLEEISGRGRRGLRALEPEFFIYRDTPEKWEQYSTPAAIAKATALAEKSLALPIERAMQKLQPGPDGNARPGFAVVGTGRNALQGIYDVLVKDQKPRTRFDTTSDVSVVFFASPTNPLRLHTVERDGTEIEILYSLVARGEPFAKWHLSIIPLGKLPPGNYHVSMTRHYETENKLNRSGMPGIPRGTEQRTVCHPFSFEVSEEQ